MWHSPQKTWCKTKNPPYGGFFANKNPYEQKRSGNRFEVQYYGKNRFTK